MKNLLARFYDKFMVFCVFTPGTRQSPTSEPASISIRAGYSASINIVRCDVAKYHNTETLLSVIHRKISRVCPLKMQQAIFSWTSSFCPTTFVVLLGQWATLVNAVGILIEAGFFDASTGPSTSSI